MTYNKAIADLKVRGRKKDIKTLRSKYVTEKNNEKMPQWLFKTPKDIRFSAVEEAVEAYKSNITKMERAKLLGKVFKFKLRFRRKKAMRQNISIPASACSLLDDELTIYKSYKLGAINLVDKKLKQDRLKRDADIKEIQHTHKHKSKKYIKEQVDKYLCNRNRTEVESEIKIMYSQPDGWHALIPYRVIPPVINRNAIKICALDPGLCTFITGSDIEGNCFTIGENCYTNLKHRFVLIDKLKAKRDMLKAKGRTYRKTNESVRLQYLKQSYAIDDLHNKSVKYLTDNYDIIILPHFNTKQIIRERNRFFNRKLLALAHYKFRMRLQAKCDVLGKKLVIVNESYTSKTCADCGLLNYHLGSSRTFSCPFCKLTIDRDINASINILHKSIIS